MMDEGGRLQRAVSFSRISPERTKAQEEEEGLFTMTFLSRDEEDGWQMVPTRKRKW